jgi:hypothetical protein
MCFALLFWAFDEQVLCDVCNKYQAMIAERQAAIAQAA